jgi:peptidoglycan/LPS O-acetylase OafA/YrhL
LRANTVGFALIAASSALLAWLVPETYLPLRFWPFVFVGLVVGAWLWWLHPKAPNSPRGWFKAILEILACGLVLAGVNFFASGPETESRFVVLYVTVFVLIVAAASLARSLAKGERSAT